MEHLYEYLIGGKKLDAPKENDDIAKLDELKKGDRVFVIKSGKNKFSDIEEHTILNIKTKTLADGKKSKVLIWGNGLNDYTTIWPNKIRYDTKLDETGDFYISTDYYNLIEFVNMFTKLK